ncbi:MAG TPA: MBL fold metallo-hydrolase [Dehalococcoidia bacterium]
MPPTEPGLHEVEDRVFVRLGEQGAMNAGFVVGEEAVAVVDTLISPGTARRLLADIRSVTDKPVRYVLNTHHHGDHTFGNQAFPEAVVIAHRECRSELQANAEAMRRQFSQISPELAQDLQELQVRLPAVTFNQQLSVHLGSRELQLSYHGPAHTRGDVIVVVPDAGVAFMGDLLTVGVVPGMRDADFPGWIRALEDLQAVGAETLIPGHGPVGDKTHLRDLRDYLSDLWGQAAEAYARGLSEEEAVQATRLEQYAGWLRPQMQAGGVRRAYLQLQDRHRHRL